MKPNPMPSQKDWGKTFEFGGCKLVCATMLPWPKPRQPGRPWCKTIARWWSTSGCGPQVCCRPADAEDCALQESVGLGNHRLRIGRSGPFFTVFLHHSRAMRLEIRQKLSSLGPILVKPTAFAFDAPSPTAS